MIFINETASNRHNLFLNNRPHFPYEYQDLSFEEVYGELDEPNENWNSDLYNTAKRVSADNFLKGIKEPNKDGRRATEEVSKN